MKLGVVFICMTCKADVTRPVVPLGATGFHTTDEMEEPRLPAGTFAVEQENEAHFGWYFVNLQDTAGTRHHSDPRRLNGCCGLDGMDGKNILCRNGHEIGTERSDCWTSHFLWLDPRSVVMKEEEGA